METRPRHDEMMLTFINSHLSWTLAVIFIFFKRDSKVRERDKKETDTDGGNEVQNAFYKNIHLIFFLADINNVVTFS